MCVYELGLSTAKLSYQLSLLPMQPAEPSFRPVLLYTTTSLMHGRKTFLSDGVLLMKASSRQRQAGCQTKPPISDGGEVNEKQGCTYTEIKSPVHFDGVFLWLGLVSRQANKE